MQASEGMLNFERPPTPVTVFVAERRDVPVYIEQIGKCVAREMVAINRRSPDKSPRSTLPTAPISRRAIRCLRSIRPYGTS